MSIIHDIHGMFIIHDFHETSRCFTYHLVNVYGLLCKMAHRNSWFTYLKW